MYYENSNNQNQGQKIRGTRATYQIGWGTYNGNYRGNGPNGDTYINNNYWARR